MDWLELSRIQQQFDFVSDLGVVEQDRREIHQTVQGTRSQSKDQTIPEKRKIPNAKYRKSQRS
jgi:hypothetical protein